jgi:hypothetical protein
MPIDLEKEADGRVLLLQVTGKVRSDEYKQIVPSVEQAIEHHGKIRMLVKLQDFQGCSAGALWQDIKFGAKHFNHIERMTVVGERKWHQWVTTFLRPFTTATVRYFPRERETEAREWLTAEPSFSL